MTQATHLRVEGDRIVDGHGKTVTLRGAGCAILNMENFIQGYAGHEYQAREELELVLGKEKADYFWDRLITYWFDAADAKFFASLGLNCVRIPFNYHHVVDDENPGVFKKEGLKHLDRMIELCAAENIYTVIDLHAIPGGQNQDWHCDSGSPFAEFWRYKDHQDRCVQIWEALATHYKDNTWVAGYNPMNEPSDPKHVRLIAFYKRVEAAIRKIDPHHILFLDGNMYGADFSHFKKEDALPNSVYAMHDYSNFGFPGPEKYVGSPEQKAKLESQFNRKVEYMRSIKGPIWNGEFGPVYASERDKGHEDTNKARYQVLKDQLEVYERNHASWSIWLYKDCGLQGMVHCGLDSPYIKLQEQFLKKKKDLAADAWGVDASGLTDIFDPVAKWLSDNAEGFKDRYPRTWGPGRWTARFVRECLLSEELCKEWAENFEGKSKEELDKLAASFKFENCVQRQGLNEILRANSGSRAN